MIGDPIEPAQWGTYLENAETVVAGDCLEHGCAGNRIALLVESRAVNTDTDAHICCGKNTAANT